MFLQKPMIPVNCRMILDAGIWILDKVKNVFTSRLSAGIFDQHPATSILRY